MSFKITKEERGKIINWIIVGVAIWLLGAGIRDWFLQTFGDSWKLALAGLVIILLYALSTDLGKFNLINTKGRIR